MRLLHKTPPRIWTPNSKCPVCFKPFKDCEHTPEMADARIEAANKVLAEDDIRKHLGKIWDPKKGNIDD